MKTGKTYYILLLLLITSFWGIGFPMIKIALEYIGPVQYLAIRFALSAVIILPIVLKNRSASTVKALKYGVVAGFFLFIGYYFQTVGLVYTTSAKSGIITGFYVILVPIIAYIHLKVKTGRVEIIASIMAFTGLMIMSLGSVSNTRVQLGDILTFICAIGYAYQILYISKHSSEVDTMDFTFFQLLFVAMFSLIALPTFEPYKLVLNNYVIFIIIFTALTGGLFGFYVMTKALIYVEPSVVAIIFVGEPIFAAIFSVILTSEKLGYFMIAGGSIMVLAMFITTLQKYMEDKGRKKLLHSNEPVKAEKG